VVAVAGGPGGCQQTARQRFLLAQSAGVFHVGSVFALLGGFWLIGAAAGGLWWRYGVEVRGAALESLVHPRQQPAPQAAS